MPIKKYKHRASVMLLAASTVAQNMLANLAFFLKDYPDWTEERITLFFTLIEEMSARLGIKNNKEQHEATLLLRKLCEAVYSDCLIVRNQIERGFRKESNRQKEILQQLGFTKYWPKAKDNQMALLDLVVTFNNNVSQAVSTELNEHGVVAYRIESIKNSVANLTNANITQEALKGETVVITEEMNTQLNEIYETAIDICTAGKTVFRKDPVRKSLFSFTRIASQLAPSSQNKSGKVS